MQIKKVPFTTCGSKCVENTFLFCVTACLELHIYYIMYVGDQPAGSAGSIVCLLMINVLHFGVILQQKH